MRILSTIFLLFISTILPAQQFDVFYLSVGSAHYAKENIEEGCKPFSDIRGARKSSRYVHEILSAKANGQGKMIRSQAGQELSKSEILDNLREVIRMAKKSKSNNPFIIFYFCGHGVSEGIAWNQFLVPGDFKQKPVNINSNPLSISIELLSSKLLYLGEVTDVLLESKLPYMCLIDACYEGKEETFSSLEYFMNPTAKQNFWDMAAILKKMNQYHSDNPVVFATKPGTTTKVVEDHKSPQGSPVGPICRKLMRVADKLETIDNLTLMDVVLLLKDPEFDAKTQQIISYYEFGENAFTTLFKK